MTGEQTEKVSSGKVTSLDRALDEIIPTSPKIEKIAGGFAFVEGPVWVKEGYLLFSDIPNNVIYKWSPDGGISVFRRSSGYDGTDAAPRVFIGSNGLTLDRQGRLIICEHGNRRVTRLEKDDTLTVLADNYQGKRLNSPNDVVCKSDGALHFTDPPYGLPGRDKDRKKELTFNGIYRLFAGKLSLLSRGLTRPNGLAFSPDEKYLYVSNSDPADKIWMRFEVAPDDGLSRGQLFFDVSKNTEEGLPDGLKVDQAGNLYCTGPGGIWIFSPEARHLGTIRVPEIPANCAWGDADGRTLYIAARTSLYRIGLKIPGVRP